MNWYDTFNGIEALHWFILAITLHVVVPCETPQQRSGVWLASLFFVLFGVSDLLEIGCAGRVSLGLWGLKVVCGGGILAGRFTWLGWNRFHLRSREMLFAGSCLLASAALLVVQRWIDAPP